MQICPRTKTPKVPQFDFLNNLAVLIKLIRSIRSNIWRVSFSQRLFSQYQTVIENRSPEPRELQNDRQTL
jgi:hypothetical protein